MEKRRHNDDCNQSSNWKGEIKETGRRERRINVKLVGRWNWCLNGIDLNSDEILPSKLQIIL